MIELATRVRLAPKARLRFDERSGQHMLLYPERGLALTDSAARIVAICGQEIAVASVVEQLAAAAPGESRARIEGDVLEFLRALEDRGLLVVGAPA